VAARADSDGRSTVDRLLDAAALRFVAVGVRATTMSSIASAAGLSRESLYRRFASKELVVDALVQRELRRFIDGLAAGVDWGGDATALLTEAFVYCVEFFRDRPALEVLVDREAPLGLGEIRARANAIVGLATRTCADYLVDLGGFDAERARLVAETLVRLVGSTLVAPRGSLDLHEPAVLRRYAAQVVPAIVRGG
jgi:AcrR family transcriptional regulator